MEILIGLIIGTVCAVIGWKIAARTDRMHPWEAAFGSFMLGPIGLGFVAYKCRERN